MPFSFYERRIFPWLNDKLTAGPEFERLREEALAPAVGRVLEIGFGTGANLARYPDGVVSVTAVEPNGGMLERARDRIRSSPVPVRIVFGRAEVLPFRDRTFDTAVSMLTLCSVSDPSASLGELRRVMRDDGRLVVFEHGLAEDPKIVRWQHRLDPLNRVIACGCHLNRPVTQLIAAQGLQFEAVRRFYLPKAPPTHGCFTMGVARKTTRG